MNAIVRFAFDASSRTRDAEGRLHVRISNISKATVNPYRGDEIPNYRKLGLDPNKVYYLLRDPEELAKAAPTFNNIQILARHVPVNASAPQKELVIGTTGTDADFVAPYLRNSLCFWDAAAIAAIESDEVKELSSAYRYSADMTPGTYEGLHYDGVMRNIIGNHVALVESGRAGSDVVVGDAALKGPIPMRTKTALMTATALRVLVTPKLAQDQAFDPSPLVAHLSRANIAAETQALAAKVVRTVTPLLAQDEALDVDDVVKIVQAAQGAMPATDSDDMPDAPAPTDQTPEPTPAVDAGGEDPLAKLLAFLKGKLSDDDFNAASDLAKPKAPGADADPTPQPGGKTAPTVEPEKKEPPAMDAQTIEARTIARMNAIREAEREVRPVCEIKIAMDSAEAVYEFALKEMGVDLKGVERSAFGGMFRALRAAAAPKPREPAHALDAASTDDFRKRFPTAGTLRTGR